MWFLILFLYVVIAGGIVFPRLYLWFLDDVTYSHKYEVDDSDRLLALTVSGMVSFIWPLLLVIPLWSRVIEPFLKRLEGKMQK